MLGWLRDKIYKRSSSESRQSVRSSTVGSDCCNAQHPDPGNPSPSTPPITMEAEDKNRITLHLIYLGEIWVVNIDPLTQLLTLLIMALGHFLDLTKNSEEIITFYKFLSVSRKKVLNLQCSVGDEGLTNYDQILLVEKLKQKKGSSIPARLTLLDIKGPTIPEIFAATATVPKKNTIQVVPSLECQELFPVEIRKVLYSLVEASAKVFSQRPDAKIVFTSIAARIEAKYKKEIDKNAIKYLVDLGFTEVQARYALRLKRNRQVEAMEWLLENSHLVTDLLDEDGSKLDTDGESDDPLAIVERLLSDMLDFQQRHFEPSSRALNVLTAMGFSQDDAARALKVTDNCQEAACRWLCGERDESVISSRGLDKDGPMYKALMSNPVIQLGLYNPKTLLAFLSILENFGTANLWLNDVDTMPVLGQVFKIYHSEKHMIVVNQQIELMRRRANAT